MKNSYLRTSANRSPIPVGRKGARKISSNSEILKNQIDFKKKEKNAQRENDQMQFDVGENFFEKIGGGKKAKSKSPRKMRAKSPGKRMKSPKMKAKSPGRSPRKKKKISESALRMKSPKVNKEKKSTQKNKIKGNKIYKNLN